METISFPSPRIHLAILLSFRYFNISNVSFLLFLTNNQWNYQTGNATVLNQLYDAYNTPYFGPLIEYINVQQTIYTTLVVYNTVISKDLSRWAITVTDLTSTYHNSTQSRTQHNTK